MAQARFSVRTAVAEGFDFWRTNWLKAVGPLALAAVSLVFYSTSSNAGAVLIGLIVHLTSTLMAQGALFRFALNDLGAEPPVNNGPLGFQWRGLETRLLGALVLTAMVMGIVIIIAVFFMAALLSGVIDPEVIKAAKTPDELVASLTPAAKNIVALVGLVALVMMLVFWARLSMALPATAAANRVRVFSSLPLTKGSTLPIIGARLLIEAPILLLQLMVGGYGAAIGDKTTAALGQVIVGILGIFFFIPIMVGATAYIYRRLTAPTAAEAF